MRGLKMLMIGLLVAGPTMIPPSYAQANEIAQLTLNLEKLRQFQQILRDLKKSYDILNKGYTTIKDISSGNFSLHKTFLDALYEVSPSVRRYKKVGEVISFQLQLVREYKLAFRRFQQSGCLNPNEVIYLADVYDNLLKLSLQNLDELITVTTAGKLRMSDDERLEAIDRIFLEMEDKLQFLRYFNNNTSILVLQRERDQKEIEGVFRWLNPDEE